MNAAVLAVRYTETWWEKETLACINQLPANVPVFYCHREPDGVGSLARAINSGFDEHRLVAFDYVWIVTNVLFAPTDFERLVTIAQQRHWVGAHPGFHSDHPFLRPTSDRYGRGDVVVPYIEFTAPLVHGPTFARYLLDEQMPYVGHDLDWSWRVRRAGYHLGVARSVRINHVYNRHLSQVEEATKQRAAAREAAIAPTECRLVEKYGPGWKQVLRYAGSI